MAIDFQDIKTQAQDLIAKWGPLHNDFKEYEAIFFMENKEKDPPGQDPLSRKVTISPTGRNSLIGMNRLLRTATPKFKAEADDGADTSAIENGMTTIVKESSRSMPMSTLHGDAFLSATLHGMVTLQIDSVDYLLRTKGLPAYEKERLADIQRRTPFLLTVIPQSESFPKFNRYGLRAHLWRYDTTVEDVRERWGADKLPNRKASQKITINDWYDMTNRAVWVDGESEPLVAEAHGMKTIPIVCKVSGGNSLFEKPEQQVAPFLYASAKAKLHQRETLLLTTLFTGMFERGAGILVGIKPDPSNGDKIVVNYSNGVRTIIGDVTPLNDRGVDNELYNAKRLLDELTGQSTIHGQSLGEGVGQNVPFSSLVTMAQTGRLPLVDPSECVGSAYAEAAKVICKWIKADGIINDLIQPADIPDLIDITCEMEPDLPQDKLRNSTIAGALKGLVSKEWIRSNLLNITDSDKMDRDIWTEGSADILYQEIQKGIIPQILQLLQGQPSGGGETPDMQMQGGGQMPPMSGPTPPQPGQMPAMPGTATVPTAPGGEAMPMTDPSMMGMM